MYDIFLIEIMTASGWLSGNRVSTSHGVGCRFTPQPGHTKEYHENGPNCFPA